MIRSLGVAEVLRLRMRAQQLARERVADVAEAVRRTAAIQAQSTRAARLALRPRAAGIVAGDVDRACNEERSVVRTWAMRATMHMLAADDVGWIVDLYRPLASSVTGRHRELGLDDKLLARVLQAAPEVMAGRGPLTRAELVAELTQAGVPVPAHGQAPIHVIAYAARQGLICRGPDRSDDEPTYVLLREWAGRGERLEPQEALVRLARRYLAAYAPASPQDFAHWSGLAVGRARQAFELIAAELEEVDAAGERAFVPAGAGRDAHQDAKTSCVRMLGQFDPYLLGYRSRNLMVPAAFSRDVQRGGMVQPAVVVDGRIVGTWRQLRSGERTKVVVEPFERLDSAVVPGLESETADLGRFQGAATELQVSTR